MTRPKHGQRNLRYCLSFRACERALGFDGSRPVARLHQDEVAIIRSSSPSRQLNGGEWRSNDNRMSVSKRSRNGRDDWANFTPVPHASRLSGEVFAPVMRACADCIGAAAGYSHAPALGAHGQTI